MDRLHLSVDLSDTWDDFNKHEQIRSRISKLWCKGSEHLRRRLKVDGVCYLSCRVKCERLVI